MMESATRPVKNKVLPAEHVRIRLIDANETYLLSCRGSFKTTVGIAGFVERRFLEMPRSSGMIVGESFKVMDNNTIRPLLQGLTEMGYREQDHWVIGKRPPESWPRPYLGILNQKYENILSIYNGTVAQMVSMEKKLPANGISAQWGVFDESKKLDEIKLKDSVFPAFRGNEEYFEKCSGYLSKFFATDKEADPLLIKWLLNKRNHVDPVTNAIVITYQLELDRLLAEFRNPDTTKTRRRILEREIAAVRHDLNEERRKLIYVAEMTIEDIRPILGEIWYADKKRGTTPRLWDVVYLNNDPQTAGDTFYPDYNKEIHEYESLDDILPNKPFIFCADYQHSVAPIDIVQFTNLPWNNFPSLNYVDEVYTLPEPSELDIQPNGNGSKGSLKEATELFCKRYAKHLHKVVYYVYDHTAKGKRVNADEYYVIVERILKKYNWRVIKVYTGRAPDHYNKYTRTADWLQHADKTLPPILINRLRCKKTIVSIRNSAAKTSNGRTEKNKDYENTTRYPNIDQSETTHFSDVFDMINHAVLFLKKIKAVTPRSGTGMR